MGQTVAAIVTTFMVAVLISTAHLHVLGVRSYPPALRQVLIPGQKNNSTNTLPFVSVLVVTTSVANWVERRQRIRAQFPRNLRLIEDSRQSALLLFAVGLQGVAEQDLSLVQQEANLHSDILFLDCLDEDDRLNNIDNWSLNAGPSATTTKVMFAAQWAVRHYDFEFLFRLGDDSYLRIDRFLSLITSQPLPTRNAMIGRFYTHNVFGVPQRFAQGSGYALTHDVCLFIARNTQYLLDTAPEDCVVSRWLYALGSTFVDSTRWRELANQEHCEPDMILAHRLPPELWVTIKDDGSVLC